MIDPAIFAGDPPIPTDGSCVVCGGPRRPERSQRYAPGIAQLDPWCSNTCARKWHHNELPEVPRNGRPRRLERRRAA